ncbi:MAG: hypothetical protein EXR06_02430 [Rickettsiales bacterium]|nr:hypothetical protein [Rickettsiales bacterium]
MQKIFTILFLLLVTSCLALTDPLFSTIPSSNNFINRFPENKKGIVLLKINSDYLALSWCQASFESEVKDKSCIKINPSNYYQIIMLEPGWYEIEGYRVINRRFQSLKSTEIEPVISNITGKRKSPPLIAFEVVEGKISYAGHIKFHHTSVSGTLIKGDDFEIIKNNFAEKNQKQLLKIFKGHQTELKIIADKINQNPEILIKNLAKTKSDFGEEKQIEKKEEAAIKKHERQFLKAHSKKMRLQKQGGIKIEKKLKNYQN